MCTKMELYLKTPPSTQTNNSWLVSFHLLLQPFPNPDCFEEILSINILGVFFLKNRDI